MVPSPLALAKWFVWLFCLFGGRWGKDDQLTADLQQRAQSCFVKHLLEYFAQFKGRNLELDGMQTAKGTLAKEKRVGGT